MSSTLLEQTRSNHEEVERLERLVVEDLQKEPPSSKDRLVQGHRVRHMIESIMLTTEKLVRFLSSSRQFLIFFSISRICFYVSSLLNTLDQSRETWVADFFLNNRLKPMKIRMGRGMMRLQRLVARLRQGQMCLVNFTIV
jgi:hypothetical protein